MNPPPVPLTDREAAALRRRIGKKVGEARRSLGLSMRALARHMGKSLSWVREVEHGKQFAPHYLLLSLGEAAGLPLEWFYGSPAGSFTVHGGVLGPAALRASLNPYSLEAVVGPMLITNPISHRELKVGTGKRGAPQVWLAGKWLGEARFPTGAKIRVEVDEAKSEIRVRLDPKGPREISRKRGHPLIELTSQDLVGLLGGVERVVVETRRGELVIFPKSAPVLAHERRRVRDGSCGSVFSGGGLLDLAAVENGYFPKWAIEACHKYAEVFAENHPSASVFALPVEEVTSMVRRGRADLPQVELLTAGIPCEPFSRKRKGAAREHEHVSMTDWFLDVLKLVNPYNVVVEQVEEYLASESYGILELVLRALGYHVHSAVMDSSDHGSLAGRRRAVIVATTDPGFRWPAPQPALARPVDVLLPPAAVKGLPQTRGGWFSVKAKTGTGAMVRRLWGRGKFTPGKSGVIMPRDTRVGAITKSYHKVQSTGPFVVHPTKPDTYRMLTVDEIKRLHGLPDSYRLPASYQAAVEILGQGVVVPLFREVIAHLPGGAVRRTITPRSVSPARPAPKRKKKPSKPRRTSAKNPARKGQRWVAISSGGVIQGKVQRVEGENVVINGVLGRPLKRA